MEQPQYNMLTRDKVEKEFHELYSRHGMGLTTFSPLKLGVLSGKYNGTTIPADSRFGEANKSADPFISFFREKFENDAEMKRNLATTQKIGEIAKELEVPQAQLAIAWALKNKNVSTVITGASRPEQVVQNIGAIAVVDKLTPEIMERIEEALGNAPVREQLRYGVPPESLGVLRS